MKELHSRVRALVLGMWWAILCGTPLSSMGLSNIGSDSFAGAPTISGSFSVEALTSTDAYTHEANEPIHSPGNYGNSAWWKWTAPSTGPCTVETLRTQILTDTVIAIYTGTALNNLARVAQDDDYGGTFLSKVTFFATAGSTYYIAVDSVGYGLTAEVLLQLRQAKDESRSYIGEWRSFNDTSINSGNGVLSLSVLKGGAATGVLTIGSKRRPFKTQATSDFRIFVNFPGTVSSSNPQGLPITLAVDLAIATNSPNNECFSVSGGANLSGSGQLSTVQPPSPATPLAGYYPVGLTFTGGTGFGLFQVRISPQGRAIVSGWAGDGQKVALGTPLATDGKLTIHQTFSSGDGYIHGRGFVSANAISISSGRLFYRRAVSAGTLYPNGLTSTVTGSGLRQTPTEPGTRALGFLEASNGAGKLTTIDAPGELSALTEPLTFTTANRFLFTSQIRKPVLKLNVATGVVTGSFEQPAGFVRKLRGVLHNDAGIARLRGFVTGSTRTAAFSVTP